MRNPIVRTCLRAVALLTLLFQLPSACAAADNDLLRQDNLVAWCIVPFDAEKRGPAERAEMLKELGIRSCAYDWRKEHVESFEEEILQYKKHGIEYFAFWSQHDHAFELFQKHDLHPQVWRTCPSPQASTQEERVSIAVESLVELAKRTQALECPFGLYNHGGWGGEPGNLVAVCKRLHSMGFDHVGIVYNFHHGHDHIDGFADSLALMKPFLLCLNLNGMNARAEPKILGIGKGEHERAMIRTVLDSGYTGRIGILDHRNELDAKESLAENLEGLARLREEFRSR